MTSEEIVDAVERGIKIGRRDALREVRAQLIEATLYSSLNVRSLIKSVLNKIEADENK